LDELCHVEWKLQEMSSACGWYREVSVCESFIKLALLIISIISILLAQQQVAGLDLWIRTVWPMSHFPILVNVNKVNWCVLTSIILLRNRTLHSQSFPIPRTFFYQSESELHTATSITTGDSKQNRNSRMSTSTTSSKVRISVIQLTSTENKTQNLKNVTGLINEAAKQGSKVKQHNLVGIIILQFVIRCLMNNYYTFVVPGYFPPRMFRLHCSG